MEYVPLALAMLLIMIPLATWQIIPDVIPLHFGIWGEPNSYGLKGALWIIPAVGLTTYFSIAMINLMLYVLMDPERRRLYLTNSGRNPLLKSLQIVNLYVLAVLVILMIAVTNSCLTFQPKLSDTFLYSLLGSTIIPVLGIFWINRDVLKRSVSPESIVAG